MYYRPQLKCLLVVYDDEFVLNQSPLADLDAVTLGRRHASVLSM
jgi:hypothetical protein